MAAPREKRPHAMGNIYSCTESTFRSRPESKTSMPSGTVELLRPQYAYRITRLDDWKRDQVEGFVQQSPLDQKDGFYHFSTAAQVPGTLGRYFVGVSDLVLLQVRTDAFEPSVLHYDQAPHVRGNNIFPHLYFDKLPLSKVHNAIDITLNEHGTHVLSVSPLPDRITQTEYDASQISTHSHVLVCVAAMSVGSALDDASKQAIRSAVEATRRDGGRLDVVVDLPFDAHQLSVASLCQVLHVHYQYLSELALLRHDPLLDARVLLPGLGAEQALQNQSHVHVIPSAAVSHESNSAATMSDAPLAVCQHAVLGGTFDHLHSGHKIMLAVAAACAAQTLVIGLSVDELLAKKKFAAELESFESRSQVLRDYLHSLHPALCVDIHPLHDIYGPSIVLPQLQTLIVSEETRAGGQMVNDRRVERGMTPCEVVVIPLVGGASGNEPTNTTKLSSTGIRQWMAQRRTLQSLAIELKPSWDSLMRHCCVSDDDGAATWTAVVSRYSEPQRAYHSLAHVAQMLRALPESGANVAIQLAIWFHDLVYAQPEVRRDLEEQSAADFWAFVSRVSLDEQLSQRVGNMILASKQHIKTLAELDQQNMDQFSRHEMQLFLQLDLSILATDAASYDAYSEAIRIEYNQVPPADFRTGRHAFLQRLLVACDDTSTLFDAFGAAEGIRMRVQARSNVERELASLLVNHY